MLGFCLVSFNSTIPRVQSFIMPPPRRGGALGGHRRPSSVRPSVRLMSRTSALTRKPKSLGRRNFAQGYPRSHATPTLSSRSKGQKSRSRGGGILWRPPSRTAWYGCSGLVVEYRTRNREVAGSTHTRSTASNLSNLLTYCVLRPTQPPTQTGTGNE